MNEDLGRQRVGPVTHLTLNRPHKANALSLALVEALIEALDHARTDGTRLLILDGAGSTFSAGFDFTDCERASQGDLALRFIRIEVLLQLLHHAPYATLALAHGRIFGAGADLVTSCSQRVATPDATFRMPGLRFGVVLGTRRLAARIGADKAREILATSRVFGAEEALRIGFITAIASQEDWPRIAESARTHCEQLSPAAAAALHHNTLADTRDQDMAALARSVSTPGLKERIAAFRNEAKRK